MNLEVKKQEKETSQALIRRFTKKVQQSRVLAVVRKNRFRKRTKSSQMTKRAALRREKLKAHYKKLDKLGQLKK